MYILSQNGEVLAKLNSLSVEDGPGGTYNIEHVSPGECGSTLPKIMANYKTLDKATTELKNIYAFVRQGSKTYTFKKDDA